MALTLVNKVIVAKEPTKTLNVGTALRAYVQSTELVNKSEILSIVEKYTNARKPIKKDTMDGKVWEVHLKGGFKMLTDTAGRDALKV